ncbi:MAG TPA: glutamine synthetase family protein [Burkholderiaceae bacterium]|nr:glutamine synthetase family protein [Burkholderiaceae bacterium]
MRQHPPAHLAADLAARGISDVECLFPDISGYPRGKLMPASAFASGAELRIAQAIPMQCVTGDYSYDPIFPDQDPDVVLVPDYTAVRPVPWAGVPRALAIHDCFELSGEPCQFAPRSILKDVMARYERHGLRAVVAPEIEFYLTAPNDDPAQPLRAPALRGGRAEVGQSAFSLNTLNEHAAFWDEFRAALETLGVRADTWIHEVGLTQFEINLLHDDPLVVADQAFLFKYAAKEVALKHGLNAVFMAKPIAGQPGSSMHLHQSVVDADGRNVFSNPDGAESPLFRQYIAGLQANLPSLMLLFAPFVNSYRRFVKQSQAPVNFHWGHDNRTAGLRIPRSGPAARRVENRVAGADANPYLVIAATLAAGLDGIERALPPTEPMDDSAYEQAHTLPRSLVAAIESFAADGVATRLFGERFVRAYASTKEVEYESWLAEIGAWERRFLVPQA